MSPEHDPRAQCGRGVDSAGLRLLPAHGLRQAPPRRPRTGSSAEEQKEREARRKKTSRRRRTGATLSSRWPSAVLGAGPALGPAAPAPALSQAVPVPLSVFSLATAPGSSLPGLGKALNSFSFLRSMPVSLPSLLNNSLHHQSLHTCLVTICHFRWRCHAPFSSPHRCADLHTQSGGVHPNDAVSSPVRGRLLSEADWSGERSSVLGLHLVCPAVLGPATPCAAGPVPSPHSDLPRGEPPLACQLDGASHIGSFHFPVFKSKMCSLFQYLSNYKIFREGLLHKGWVELCFIRYCFLFDNRTSNPPLNYC